MSSTGQGVEGLYQYFQHDGEHLRVEYPELSRMQFADGILVPDELWEPILSQYSGFLAGETLSEVVQTYLGIMRPQGTANARLGSLMPLVSPIVVTRNRAGYVIDRLIVVNEYVGRPDGLFGGI